MKRKYCCIRLKESIYNGSIGFSPKRTKDETRWFINGGYHIYFCPFCGKYIKGKGWGRVIKGFPKYYNITNKKKTREEQFHFELPSTSAVWRKKKRKYNKN